MATVTLYATGDEIGVYDSVSTSGNGNGMKVTLSGVQALGSSTDVFRIVVNQVNNGADEFSNGQFVSIYAEPETDPPSPPLYSYLNPQHDMFQGRASSGEHQIFSNPAKIVFDINGINEGTMQYGPGLHPLRSGKLEFDSFSSSPPEFPCFGKGTLIEAQGGPLPVEILKIGDLVKTATHGMQPIRWIGHRTVSALTNLAPIKIDAGALGNYRDLVVSPQHRMLVSDWRAEMWFGRAEVLVAAKHLVDGAKIRQMPARSVTYYHMIFDQHEIIFAEGIPSESLHLGEMTMSILDQPSRAEVLRLFPDLETGRSPVNTAHPCLSAWEGALLAQDKKSGVLSPAA